MEGNSKVGFNKTKGKGSKKLLAVEGRKSEMISNNKRYQKKEKKAPRPNRIKKITNYAIYKKQDPKRWSLHTSKNHHLVPY